jgi:hypothetical protein
MKTLVSILLLSSLMVAPLLAAGADLAKTTNKSAVVQSLNLGIKSDNEGLRTSAAVIIKQVIDNSLIKPADFSSSLIPLLRMLENGKTEDERIAAAVALLSLDNSIGIYRLRGSARFDESEKVRSVSKNLYYFYHTSHHSTYFLDF